MPFTSTTEEIQRRLIFNPSKRKTTLSDGIYMAINQMKKATALPTKGATETIDGCGPSGGLVITRLLNNRMALRELRKLPRSGRYPDQRQFSDCRGLAIPYRNTENITRVSDTLLRTHAPPV